MPRPTLRKKLAVAAAALVAFGVAAELGFRLLAPRFVHDYARIEAVRKFVDSGAGVYEPRPYTAYGNVRNASSNSLGFRGQEWPRNKTAGIPRIACIGASTTEGGNAAGRKGSYPWLLREELTRLTGRDFEILNFGVAGWTTAESMINWFLIAQDFEPDLVLIHHAVNDVHPRRAPGYRDDYVHWRRSWTPPEYSALHRFLMRTSELYTWLTMRKARIGILEMTTYEAPEPAVELVPQTAAAFRRNVETTGEHAAARGAAVALMTMPFHPSKPRTRDIRKGTAEHNAILREICAERGWMLVDAEPLTDASTEHLFLDVVHLKREGNRIKAALAAEVLVRDWLPSLDTAGREEPR